ncbi:MAG: FG-GAP repeat protein [Planctomycetaceae bacterium]|nr:FG-GAP repeat protein [Planctomycetaceae bacterium]
MRRVRRGAKPSGFHATEALESRVMLAGTIGEVTSFTKISDTEGNFTAVLDDSDLFGRSVSDLGDLDGDGINDIAVGAEYDDDGGTNRGAIYIQFLNADGTVKSYQKISSTEGNFTATLDDSDFFGAAVSNLGDLDGDGIADLAVGAWGDDDGSSLAGAVYVLFLNQDGTVKSHQKISNTEGNFTGTLSNLNQFGSSLANIGDFDGDGVTDLAVGATGDHDGGFLRGAVYILQLNSNGTVKSHQKISDTNGNFTAPLVDGQFFGTSVTNLGDLDGDGVQDLAVGALHRYDGGTGRGTVYILFLNADGTVKLHQVISDTEGNLAVTFDEFDFFSKSVANLGDLDGDGVTDLAVGAYGDGEGSARPGAVYVLFLNTNGTVKAHHKIDDTQGNLGTVLATGDAFGLSVSRVGDIDGDGLPELAVGAVGDDDGGTNRGAVYILSLEQVTPPGVVTSFSKISDTLGNFVGVLDDCDSFGWSATDLGDLDGDGIADLAVGAIGDDDGGYNRGAVYVLFMNAAGSVKSHQKISDTEGNFTAVLENSDYFGWSLANLGDLDGDGIMDLAVGAYLDDDGGIRRGAVYLLFLNADGTVKSQQKISDTAGNFTANLDDGDVFGSSLANLGDLDGDGIVDLAVGAIGDDDGGGNDQGAVYVLFLNLDGTVKSHQKISGAAGNLAIVLENNERFGTSLTNLGDLNGDGIGDLGVGSSRDDGGINRGAVYVLFLNIDGTVNSHQKISNTDGNLTATLDDDDWFGHSLTNIGDLDGDGVSDLVVGALGDDDGFGGNSGAVYVLFLNADGTVKAHQKISDIEGNFTATLEDGDAFGLSLTSLGDLDGDGTNELAVGTHSDDDGGQNRGAVYVLFMNTDGTVESHQKISDTMGNFTATLDDSDFFGAAVTSLGDLDGDGINDLAVGTMGDDDGSTVSFLGRGAVYVLFLNADGTVKSHQKISDTEGNFTGMLNDADRFGWSVTSLPDLNGDGIIDLAVGAIGEDYGDMDSGAVYVLLMNTDGTVKARHKISDTDGNFIASLDDNDHFGWSVTHLGDLDGDGFTELVVGASGDDDGGSNRGAVYIVSLEGVVPSRIIDDGDPAFSTVGSWTSPARVTGHEGDVHRSPGGDGQKVARWEFTGLVPGNYRVSATWPAHVNRATNSPFSILDGVGGRVLHEAAVNQELPPDDFADAGSDWEDLVVVRVTGDTLVVELSNDANGYVIADAIRLEATDLPAAPPLPISEIVDDGDPDFATTGNWVQPAVPRGHEDDLRHSYKGTGADTATWTFTDLTPGDYQVSATWFAHFNRATDAPFTLFDGIGGPEIETVLVNQQFTPDDFTDAGSDWETLTTVSITGSELVVQLTDAANGYVIADAVRVDTAPQFTLEEREERLNDVVLGLHQYHNAFGQFPVEGGIAALVDVNGHRNLSWRVQLLPFMGYGDLYQQFHHDEPWNSPHNLSLINLMPDEFRSRGLPVGTSYSGYRMFEGNGAVEYDSEGGPQISDAADGAQHTLLVLETLPQDSSPWTKPDGIPFNPASPLAGLALPPDTFLAATVNDDIKQINPTVAPETFSAFATWNGDEVLSSTQYANLYHNWDAEDSAEVSREKLKDIGLGLHNFHDYYLAFPPDFQIPTEWFDPATGLPYLSWRVHLLQVMGYKDLYQQFHFDEPWDSPNNIQLLDKMPEEFRSRGLAPGGTTSAFKIITGDEAYRITYDPSGPKTSRGSRIQSVIDGLNTSIAVIELPPDKAVPWTQWNEVEFNAAAPLDGIGPIPADGLRVVMTDGSVHTINPLATGDNFGIFATWAGEEIFGPAESNNAFTDWPLQDSAESSQKKLGEIINAQHLHFDRWLRFAGAGSIDGWDATNNRPYLSWRVYLLPYLGYQDLFDQFHLDEPWDSPRNLQLLDKMPEVFRSRGLSPDSTLTGFQVFLGEDAYSYQSGASTWSGPDVHDFVDGYSNTISVVELLPSQAVEWTRPDGDIMFDPNHPLAGVGDIPTDGLRVLMFDGRTYTINPDVTEENFKSFVTFSGGESFGFAETSNVFLDWQRPPVNDSLEEYDEDLAWRRNNMRFVGSALHNYHELYARFPVANWGGVINSATGLPFLSWRVHLLPYLGYSALYSQFHLDEPWDSPHNIQLLDKMPEFFRSRGLPSESTKTGLQFFVGEGAYEYTYGTTTGGGSRIRDISDGTSNTIAVIETMPEDAVEWTRPDGDIAWDENDPYGSLTIPPDFFLAMMFDTSVRPLHPLLHEDTFRSRVTFAAGD